MDDDLHVPPSTQRAAVTGRRDLPTVHRLVVKVGTSSLTDDRGATDRSRLAAVVDGMARTIGTAGDRRESVLVSSGAIATGLGPMGLTRRPRAMPRLQAAAAVGQGLLMASYLDLFAGHGLVAAQVLLTTEDFVRRRHFVNAQRTFQELLAAGVVPVVNENDTIATEEISFGDNDRLAALVAVMVAADLLVLLSDVDGIFTRDPSHPDATLLPVVTDPLQVRATGPTSDRGSGGMASKLEAAGIASAAGIAVVVANAGLPDVLPRIIAGEEVGTWIPARGDRKRARKAWMAFVAAPRGRIVVDAGAELAIRDLGKSLLPAGVVGLEGSFAAGDTVEVVGPHGRPFARGVAAYSAADLPRLAGRSTRELIEADAGYDRAVIHRDELVVIPTDLREGGEAG